MRKTIRQDKVLFSGKAVVFFMVCGGDVLLQKRASDKSFANELIIPGGRVKKGESYLNAVEREVFEETGLQITKPKSLGPSFKAITPKAYLFWVKAFMVKVNSKKDVTNNVPHEGVNIWVTFDKLKEIKWAHSQLVYERAMKFLRKND